LPAGKPTQRKGEPRAYARTARETGPLRVARRLQRHARHLELDLRQSFAARVNPGVGWPPQTPGRALLVGAAAVPIGHGLVRDPGGGVRRRLRQPGRYRVGKSPDNGSGISSARLKRLQTKRAAFARQAGARCPGARASTPPGCRYRRCRYLRMAVPVGAVPRDGGVPLPEAAVTCWRRPPGGVPSPEDGGAGGGAGGALEPLPTGPVGAVAGLAGLPGRGLGLADQAHALVFGAGADQDGRAGRHPGPA
jgi:hypothetical protein